MRQRISGPLDKLIAAMPNGLVSELAHVLKCNRRSILRWQRGAPLSVWSRMRVNSVAIAYGLKPLFEERQGSLPFNK